VFEARPNLSPGRKPWAFLLLLGVLASALGACTPAPELAQFEGQSMGTTWSAKIVAQPLSADQRTELRQALASAIEDVNQKMSTYRDDSELSRLNQAQADQPVDLSLETMTVFRTAAEVGELSDGAFDVTVGPLVNAWGFGPGHRREDVSDDELNAMLSLVGWDKIQISNNSVQKTAAGVYCDLSALAKGYAVDQAARAAESLGYTNFMVEIGGEVRTSGHNGDDRPWRIGIEQPSEEGRAVERVVQLSGLSMATSGDYRSFWEEDGQRFSHTIDPRTGRPVRHRLASVSVIESDCMRADAFATALMVLGEEEGFRLAERLELAALFQVRLPGGGFESRPTPAFERLASD